MGIVLADGARTLQGLVDVVNRYYKRDKGTSGFGDRVLWTAYSGAGFVLTLQSENANGDTLAILLKATSPTASPTAANSVLIVQDGAISIGAQRPLDFYNTAGNNAVELVHSGTNDLLKTTKSFYVAAGLNVGSGVSATAAVDGRINVGESVILRVDEGQFRGVIASATTDYVLVIGIATDTTVGGEHFAVTAGGNVEWGPGGAAARDVTLSRSTTATLAVTGALTVSHSANPVLAVNQSGSAAVQGLLDIRRAGTSHGYIGLDAADNLAILNATPVAVAHVEATFLLPTVPCIRATASGTTVHTASATPLDFDATSFNNDTMLDTTNHRVKATRAGVYRVSATVSFPGSANGTLRWIQLQYNGTTTFDQDDDTNPAGTFGGSLALLNATGTYAFAAGDYVEVLAYQDTGGDQTVTGNVSMEFVSN